MNPVPHDCLLLANRPIAEGSALGVVDLVGHNLLDFLGQALLQSLRDLGVAGCVGDFASVLVAAGVVDGVWELIFDGLGGLWVGVS